VQALGIGTPAFVAIEQGVERALRAMEGFIRSGRYRQAEGYVAELWGQYEIIDRIGVSAAQTQVGLVAIQQAVPPSAKMADATLRLYQNTQGGAIVRVIWDSKNWSQQYLDFVLSAAGNARFIRLVQQIQGYQLDVEHRVVLQFTQRGNTATNLNNLWQQLSDPAHGLDMTRISLRTHKMWETVPSQTFNSGVH
jgi:hypothetical protein